MPFQLSPGVAVVEKDFTSIVPAVATSIGASAGAFAWGPVMEPNTVSSENELVRRFGKPNDNNFESFFSAANFLSYTNNLLLVRADAAHTNAVSSPSAGVTSFTVTDAGSGYVSTADAPTVTVSAPDEDGGDTVDAIATLSGGAITAIAISSAGSGYVSAPTITITTADGDTGSGATATCNIDSSGAIDTITITNGGSGYKATPTVALSGGTDSSTTEGSLGAVTVGTSTITSIVVDPNGSNGSGYTSAPTVTVAAPPSGTTATATATISPVGLKIKNGEEYLLNYANGAGVVGEWAARYPGTMGNSLKVSIADKQTYDAWTYKAEFDGAPGTSTFAAGVSAINDEMHVIVIDEDGMFTGTEGAILEKFAFVSKASNVKKSDGTNNYYKDVINTRSEYIYWMDHPSSVSATLSGGLAEGNTGGTTDLGTGVTVATIGSEAVANKAFQDLTTSEITWSLSGGTDDYALTDGEKTDAFDLMANAEQYDISLIVAGKASATVASHLIQNIAEDRLDCVAFVSPENTATGEVIIGNTSTQVNAINSYRDALPSSSYGVMDSGVKYQYDRYNDKYRWVPLNADVAGLAARTDYTNDAWFSPAGLSRGQIKSVVRLGVNPNKTQRDSLYKNGVNPVVSFPGEGVVLFGDKTLLSKPSAFDRINVRRLFIVLEKAISTASKYQLFEFNDSFTRAQFKNLVEPFLRDVQGRRGITDFVVKCDESNNTGEVIDRNEFVADIFIKPTRSINYITLNFVAARSGINFSEVGA
jgi:phage tail sheath protein FI